MTKISYSFKNFTNSASSSSMTTKSDIDREDKSTDNKKSLGDLAQYLKPLYIVDNEYLLRHSHL